MPALTMSSRSLARVHEGMTERARDGLSARMDTELRVDVLDVGGHRLWTDEERMTDLHWAEAFCEQVENLALARGEPGPAVPIERAPSSEMSPNARDELVRVDWLRQVVVGTNKQSGDPVVRLRPITRDEQDRKLVAMLLP
jgi:hypothetical protein